MGYVKNPVVHLPKGIPLVGSIMEMKNRYETQESNVGYAVLQQACKFVPSCTLGHLI